ncbi:MAG: biotin--[acetyl-CoA-carboxylase] ligase [Pirellulales bacterium]|nr:biotin--[acetyl-CoA-carboxylase] ligase [Pirellulales bacterium]
MNFLIQFAVPPCRRGEKRTQPFGTNVLEWRPTIDHPSWGRVGMSFEFAREFPFARYVEIHDELGSTNDRAAQLAPERDLELPALVLARRQTAGRGRGANRWWSAEGALTFSLLIEPARLGLNSAQWPQLSLATAVAVCDAISAECADSSCELRATIKWPNDVLLDGRKACGILIESPGGEAPAKDRLIIGIGVNVNNSWREAPADLATHTIALCDTTHREHDRLAVLSRLLLALELRIGQLASDSDELPREWQRACWLHNKQVCIQQEHREINGTCRGIDSQGALILKSPDALHRLFSGSVIAVQDSPLFSQSKPRSGCVDSL